MPSLTPQTDPEQLRAPEADSPSSSQPDGPVTFVPHETSGAVSGQPVRIQTARYGTLEAHELVRLLDSIEDERARGRFRESIYISVFVWLAIAWLVLWGPQVLWHAPRIKFAQDTLKSQELTTLTAPVMPHVPVTPPRVDTRTLEHLREETARRAPTPPAPKPEVQPQPQPRAAAPAPAPTNVQPATPRPAMPIPSAPKPQPTRQPPPVVADAPQPQPDAGRSSFHTSSPTEEMNELARMNPRSGGAPPGSVSVPVRGGGAVGSGSEILSDTEGVDFSAWKRRFDRGTIDAWLPLLPEEIQPPLMKKGETMILLTVLPDGSIGGLKLEGSTHDDALNRAAWGSITSQGKLPPLPKAFHGPNIVLRLTYMVNEDR